MVCKGHEGVPEFVCTEYCERTKNYCLLIPVINEGQRIQAELRRAQAADVSRHVDIVICDGGSVDGSLADGILTELGVNTLLVKTGPGKQGAQLRMGIWWALERGYEGIITVDGNNKDSIEDVPAFVKKLEDGYDFVQGSRFIAGGKAVNTPFSRYWAVKLLHAPAISLTAGQKFTDTTNAFRAYSRRYLEDPRVRPLRDIFAGYELLAYLSVRASQLGLKACEIPVCRAYPKNEKTPTKISPFKGNLNLLKILLSNAEGKYLPEGEKPGRLSTSIQFVKFLLVGASNTVVLLAVYYLVLWLLGRSYYLLGQTLGYAAGILNSFFWNSRYVFAPKKKSGAASFLKMTLSYGVTYVLQAGLLTALVDWCHVSEILAPLLAIAVTTPINFVLNRLFVFPGD